MNSKIIIEAITSPNGYNNFLYENQVKNIKELTGKLGSICYMTDSYNDIKFENKDKSIKRYDRIIKNGHHSIVDHCYITLIFENITKMQAMVLNSFQCYTTSEKSARYTVFQNNTEQEDLLFNKWKNYIIENNNKLPGLNIEDENKLDKIANENARYFLSIFNKSTTMAYTISIRQLNYILNWIENLISNKSDLPQTKFNELLILDMINLSELIRSTNISFFNIEDNKNRHISFLSKQTNDISLLCNKDHFGPTYNTMYKASFSQLAQAQRHRTLKYHMLYDGTEKDEYFIPEFLQDKEIINEWLNDMKTIDFPQGLLVNVVEMGTLENFLLKCKERLCYRAQIEICKQTAHTLIKYYKNYIYDKDTIFSKILQGEIDKYVDLAYGELKVKPKCSILGNCKEPCGNCKKFLHRTY